MASYEVFEAVCKVALGDRVPAEVVWEDLAELGLVEKMSPDPSDVHVPSASTRKPPKKDWEKQVSRASNAVGITAATGAILPTLTDERLKSGGKVARGLHRNAERATKKIQATRPGKRYVDFATKHKAKLALGAAGLQVGNLAGDVVTSRVLGRKKRAEQPVVKGVPKITVGTKKQGKKLGQAGVDWASRNPGKAALGTLTAVGSGGYLLGKQKGIAQSYNTSGGFAMRDSTADVVWDSQITKLDGEKRLAFGWASIVKLNGQNVVDKQDDFIGPDDLEDAAYEYVLRSRKGGDMHARDTDELGQDVPMHKADLVESVVLTPEKIREMGLPEETPVGWWTGFKVRDDQLWNDVKTGKRTGFSIHGKGKRRLVDYDEVMSS